MRTMTRGTGTALVMHNDVWVRSRVAATLGDAGYTVMAASNGASGVRLAEQHRPQVIVLGMALSEVSGAAVLEQLHDCPTTRDIPVVVVSSSASESREPAGLSGGARRDRVALGNLLPEVAHVLGRHGPEVDLARSEARHAPA